MSINDLDLILDKDPIISTFLAQDLCAKPADVEREYMVHARTHLPLGDTSKYVDAMFRWVGGANKGAFIGGVLGEFGEGKTSFLVHIWEQSRAKGVFAIPPFEWKAFEHIVEAIAGWATYILSPTHPLLAKRIERLQQALQRQTAEALARAHAEKTGKPYEELLGAIESFIATGDVQLTSMSGRRLLDFMAEVTSIVQEAGYKGLLLLLDEPEIAAKALTTEAVAHFFFDLANDILNMSGEFGIFLSMPRTFFSAIQSRFSSLAARLGACGCFPSLADLYGAGFAQDLWMRYVAEFGLGEEGMKLLPPLTLRSVGQIGSSERKDLSFGPRSVVSAFSRAVDSYRQTGTAYSPQQLIEDMLHEEVLVQLEYRSRLHGVLHSAQVNDGNREAVTMLAAFPDGLDVDTLRALGIEDVIRSLATFEGPVYKTASTMGLRALRPAGGGTTVLQVSELERAIDEIDSEFAVGLRAFTGAMLGFEDHILPSIFVPRSGQQLDGWTALSEYEDSAPDLRVGTLLGAFRRTSNRFPGRAAVVEHGSLEGPFGRRRLPKIGAGVGPSYHDLHFQFRLRWHDAQPLPACPIEIREPDYETHQPITVTLTLDLCTPLIGNDFLASRVGADRLTPLYVLHVLHRMKAFELERTAKADWDALTAPLQRALLGTLFDAEVSRSISDCARHSLGEVISGSFIDLLDEFTLCLLERRYPAFSTLMRQPRWQSKVDDYINALHSDSIPLSSKRGAEPWLAESEVAERVFRTSRMNLTGGAFQGFDSLLTIATKGRNKDIEVGFRLHPMEKGIRDYIRDQPRSAANTVKVDGKACPYVRQAELLPELLSEGYTLEELKKIIEIGVARKSFEVGQFGGEQILYCRMFDPEDLREQLRAKLSDLVAEIERFQKLPGFKTPFDPAIMEKGIEKVEDEAGYDKLAARMARESEQNRAQIPGYFAQLQTAGQASLNAVRVVESYLKGREVQQLASPQGSSPWCDKLGRYIVPTLKRLVAEHAKTSNELVKRIGGEIVRYRHDAGGEPIANLDLLLAGYSQGIISRTDVQNLQRKAQELSVQIKDFEEWRALLRKCDELRERLVALKTSAAHGTKAQEFFTLFDAVCTDISEHLEVHNVTGLPSHKQFAERLEELAAMVDAYLQGIKASFDRRKDQVNQLLGKLGVDYRLRMVFNHMDPAGCYEQLFGDAVDHIQSMAITQALEELAEQQRELVYAREILQALTPEAVDGLLRGVETQQQAVEAASGYLTVSWLQDAVEAEADEQLSTFVQVIDSAFSVVHYTQRQIRTAIVPHVPEDGHAKKVYDLLGTNAQVDLKQVILQAMDHGSRPNEALEDSLSGLMELFRNNCVQIVVGRRTH